MVDFDYLMKEYAKCFLDKSRVYMIQNFLKTYDATQRREVPFKLFPRQQDLCNTLGNASNVVTTKPRQAGITTTSAAFIACEMILAEKETPQTVLAIGNTLDLAQQMLFKIRDFLLQFPLWMWGEEYTDSGYDITKPPDNKNIIFDVCNGKEIKLKNGCKIVARSSGPDASRGVGGVTWLIFDEAAFIENGNDVYASALPTVSTGGHIIMISTPNGKDLLYYETCRKAKLKGSSDWNNFELVELKWYQDPRYNKFLEWTRKDPETGEIIIEKEDYIDKQGNIEYVPEKWFEKEKEGWKPRSSWYTKMCQQFNNDEQKIAQELDVSFLGSAANVVDPEAIEMQETLNVRTPLFQDPLTEDMWIWKEPIEGHRYIIAGDISRGDAADRTAIEIIDLDGVDENGQPIIEQVAEYYGKMAGDEIGEMMFQYGNMYNEAHAVVDCIGGVGDATVLILRRLGYRNLYYDDPTLKTYTMQRDASSLKVTNDGKLPGFHSSSVRWQMLSNFANMIKTNQFKVRSKRMITELETWIYKNGRMDHMDGCHDDSITCAAMGMFVVKWSLDQLVAAKKRDAVLLKAYVMGNNIPQETQVLKNETINISQPQKKRSLPMYSGNEGQRKNNNNPYGQYMWLIR